MLSFECIKNEKSVYFLLTSALLSPFENYPPNMIVFVLERDSNTYYLFYLL